ncbi:translation initiation factor IF-3 [Candidatus Dependentiae bacterium]|nr:translation initiation factor IF-3 [Candidatus Dependentiae bacterium]
MTLNKKTDQQLINENIRAFKVRVISNEGENLGVMTRDAALVLALQQHLDLVLLSDKDDVPLVKIMDFGKSLYLKKKKVAEGKKKQKVMKVKEIKMRTKIGQHDYLTKINQGIRFLKDGNKVKITLKFYGREMDNRQTAGLAFFNQIQQSFVDEGLVVLHEKDAVAGPLWSRIYMLKAKN